MNSLFSTTSLPFPDASLSTRAMLAAVSVSVWPAAKHDKTVSEETATRHGASRDALRSQKSLLVKSALAELREIRDSARREHNFLTLPWADEGFRILPASAFDEHTRRMRAFSDSFLPAVDKVIQDFPDLVSAAKPFLGTMFNVHDYPGLHEEVSGRLVLVDQAALREKFSFETKVMPLPEAGDFRVNLGSGDQERIRRQITARVEAALQVAGQDLWQRLYKAVKEMAERLVQERVTEKGLESVVANLVKLVDILPQLNLTKDAELERLAEEARKSLLATTSAELKESKDTRTDIARAASDISHRMAAYMVGFGVPVPGSETPEAA